MLSPSCRPKVQRPLSAVRKHRALAATIHLEQLEVRCVPAGSVTITAVQGPDTLSAAVPVAIEGQLANPSLNATFTDTNAVTPANLTVTVDYGDGTPISSNQAGPNFDPNLLVTQIGGAGGTTYVVTDNHTFPEESGATVPGVGTSFNLTLTVTENANAANTDTATGTAEVQDAPLSPGDPVTPVSAGVITGGNTGNVTTAAQGLANFEAAIGGVKNTAPSPQNGGFRTITWDAVKVDGTDSVAGPHSTTVITPGHTVGIPLNRFQGQGVFFGAVYAVSNDGFVDVNPNVSGLFPAFSTPNTFAMFNDNGIDFKFVQASTPNTAPVNAASRGFGAIFLNVQQPGTTITYLNGNKVLDTLNVPTNASAGAAIFAGELFTKAIVTNVLLTLGTGVIFKFDGTTVTSGGANTAVNNLVAVDDWAYAEPVATTAPLVATNQSISGPVGHFSDLDPNGNAHDYTAIINWGDGHQSVGSIAADGHGGFAVSGSNTFSKPGNFQATVNVQDFGSSSVTLQASIVVPPLRFAAGADQGNPSMVHVYDGTGVQIGSFFAFDPAFLGGVRVAVGDVNGDGVSDIIVAAGPGGGPHVKIIDGTKLNMVGSNGEIQDAALLGQFYAYNPAFAGGVFVAFGHAAAQGPEITTGAGAGGTSHVKVIDASKIGQLQSNAEIANSALPGQFLAYNPLFSGGVTVAVADLNGDGILDVVTGAGPGGGPHVKVIDGSKLNQLQSNSEIADSALIGQFYAYSPSDTDGVFVAASSNNGHPIVVTSHAVGAGQVEMIDATKLNMLTNDSEPTAGLGSFFPYNPHELLMGTSAHIALLDFNLDGVGDILIGPSQTHAPEPVEIVDGTKLNDVGLFQEILPSALLDSFFAFGSSFTGGVFVGGG
jgi:hypothetical protein